MSTDTDVDFLSEEHFFEDELANILKVTPRTLRGWRQRRIGPPWVKPTGHIIIYPKDSFREWLKAEMVRPLSNRSVA